jgi:predicted metal-dependent hydrolase
MSHDKTPTDLTITPRDRRFGRGTAQKRWWLNDDPIASTFHDALSITFPKGEAFFVESVKAFREGASPKLSAEIRSFVMQEVMHSREHVAFNNRVIDAGYQIADLEKVVVDSLELTKDRPQILNLAVTMWDWHAIEEIEHKGVAYDTWMHGTRDWSAWKRWKVKAIMMLVVTKTFWPARWSGTLELLRQDGLTGWRIKARLAWFLFGTPGVVRRMIPAWLAFFMPGFHPWNHDDRALIAKVDSDYAAAVLPQPAMAA